MSLTQTQTSPPFHTYINGFSHGNPSPSNGYTRKSPRNMITTSTSTTTSYPSTSTSTPYASTSNTAPFPSASTTTPFASTTTTSLPYTSSATTTPYTSTTATSLPYSSSTTTSAPFTLNLDTSDTFIQSFTTATSFTSSSTTTTPTRSPSRHKIPTPIQTISTTTTTTTTTTPSSLTLLLQQQQHQLYQQNSTTLSSTSTSHQSLSTSTELSPPDMTLLPISTSTLTSTISSSTTTTQPTKQRQIARKTLYGLSEQAFNMINKTKESSRVMNFSINAINKLVTPAKSFTQNKLEAYGDPLLSYLDTKIDEAYNTVENTASYYLPERKHEDLSSHRRSESDGMISTSLTTYENGGDVDMEKSMSMLALREEDPKTVYQMYWDRVKEKFVHSKWYSKVDEILVQNTVKAFAAKVVSPAEFFYNAVSDEFATHGTVDDFMIAIKSRVGDQWDDRLKPLAKAFYTTAKAVSVLVGGAKMVGNTIQQSKEKATNKVHNAIDDLLETWDKVLDLTDDVLDKWFPEKDQHPRLTHDHTSPLRLMDARGTKHRWDGKQGGSDMDEFELDGGLEYDDDGDYTSDGDGEMDGVFTMDEDGKDIALSNDTSPMHPSHYKNGSNNRLVGLYSSDDDSVTDEIEFKRIHNSAQNEQALVEANTASSTKKRTWESHVNGSHRSVVPLAQKITKRLRQRIPSMRGVSDNLMGWAEELKQNLLEHSWFQSVDEILMQNMLVKALADIIRPAEHFFNTSLQLFQTKRTRHAIAQATSNKNSPKEQTPLALPSTASSSPPSSVPIVVVDDFIDNLKKALGASWDDRLIGLAKSFFTLAVKMKPQGVDVSDTSDTD